jgi:hypothetical protein
MGTWEQGSSPLEQMEMGRWGWALPCFSQFSHQLAQGKKPRVSTPTHDVKKFRYPFQSFQLPLSSSQLSTDFKFPISNFQFPRITILLQML